MIQGASFAISRSLNFWIFPVDVFGIPANKDMPRAEDTPTLLPPGGVVPALRADRLLDVMRGYGRL